MAMGGLRIPCATAVGEKPRRELHAPHRQVVHPWMTQQSGKSLREHRSRHTGRARQSIDRPCLRRRAVQRRGRDLARRRRFEHPRRAQLEIEIDRATQANGPQHVGQNVSGHAARPAAGCQSIQSGRTSRPERPADARQEIPEACTWCGIGGGRSVETSRAVQARDIERISL